MPTVIPTYKINIPDAGATVALSSTLYVEKYLITLTGTGTMSGNTSITDDGISVTDSVYVLEFPGGVTLGVQTFTVFGVALTAAQALNKCMIVARWTGSAFTTQIYTDWAASNTVLLSHMTDNSVGTSELVDASVTLAKQANLARGRIIVGDATARPAAVNLGGATAGSIPVADGTDVAIVTPSGDWTQNGAGVNVIGTDKITTTKILAANVTLAKLADLARGSIIRGSSANRPEALSLSGAGAGAFINTDGTDVLARLITGDLSVSGASAATISVGLNTYIAKVTIPTASVLTANSVPISLIGAPGANKYIRPIACMNTLTFNSIAYATNGLVQLRHDTATDPCMTAGTTTFLFGTVTHTAVMEEAIIGAATDTQIIVNKALLWEVATGNPVNGNSDCIAYILYQIVDV